MDISRPDLKKRRLRRNALWMTGALIAAGIGTFFILRLKPAIPASACCRARRCSRIRF
jgi:hypothetical protein